MQRRDNQFDPREFLQTRGLPTLSLDGALEYFRARGMRFLPEYVAAMAPMSLAVLFLIDAISAQRRSVLTIFSVALVPATLWRWAWLARIQQLVQQDVLARKGQPLRTRLLWILLTRLYANAALTWGSIVIAPSFYGFYVGTFAAPLLLDRDGPMLREVAQLLVWIHHSTARLVRIMLVLTVLMLVAVIAALVIQWAVVAFLLPSILDLDATGLSLTFRSIAWRLSCLYFIGLGFDFYWTIASVFLYYDSQSRRTGSDLRARLSFLVVTGSET